MADSSFSAEAVPPLPPSVASTTTSNPAVGKKAVDPYQRRHTDAGYVVFYGTLFLSLYFWRYGSILQFLTAFIGCILSAPDHFASRSYKAFMEYPDQWILNFNTPPEWVVLGMTAPFRFINPVKVRGVENIPKPGERILFVGNHQIWALDVPLKFSQIYLETGMYVRAITDRSHNAIPFYKHALMYLGGVPGTREATQALMDKGVPLLIYPGGALEVFKGKDDDPYGLCWKDRNGFARMAAENGYKIVPFASVGMADAVKILFTIPAKYMWALIGDTRAKKHKRRRHHSTAEQPSVDVRTAPPKATPPVPPRSEMGDGIPVLAPYLKPQTNYIWFGEAIDAKKFVEETMEKMPSPAGSDMDSSDVSIASIPPGGFDEEEIERRRKEASVRRLRDVVKVQVEKGVRECLKWREEDPERFNDVPAKVVEAVKGLAGQVGKKKKEA
ncbi:hypothetical protein HDU97_006996 [Phlyctochytrium planicorne]|nr:hypothetical protein HDU97_006996 [Phlyctochytrium planicorne]